MTERKAGAGRLRRSGLAVLAALFGALAVLLGASTAYAGDAVPAVLSPAQGGSKTAFNIAPGAQRCGGSVETAYIYPLSGDPRSAFWAAPDQPIGTNDQPVGGYRPFVSGTSSHGSGDAKRHHALWFAG